MGTADELICVVISSETAALTSCQPPRKLALGTVLFDLGSRDGSTGLRVAFIPDAFVDVATQLSAIGLVSGNVLVVEPDVEPADQVLTNSAVEQYKLSRF